MTESESVDRIHLMPVDFSDRCVCVCLLQRIWPAPGVEALEEQFDLDLKFLTESPDLFHSICDLPAVPPCDGDSVPLLAELLGGLKPDTSVSTYVGRQLEGMDEDFNQPKQHQTT